MVHPPSQESSILNYQELCANGVFKHQKMDFSQIHLIYRAEGNANLVLVLPQQKKVLRLPKTSIDTSEIDVIVDPYLHVAYLELMTRVVGKTYSNIPDIARISTYERLHINQFATPFRPVERLCKEFCGQFGFLFPDATHLPDTITADLEVASRDTYCIEIKPKQGWMIQEIDIENLFDLKGIDKCRYCCMQYLKLENKKISKLNEYCPMDLFSGHKLKMKNALNALFDTPQNNLRVFKNGILIYGTEHLDKPWRYIIDETFYGNEDQFQDLIIACLLKNFNSSENSSLTEIPLKISNGYHDERCNTQVNLPPKCILARILELQLLAKKNIEFMSTGYYKERKSYDYLEDMISNRIEDASIVNFTPKEQYTIGATLMDCSIMIAFQKLKYNERFNPSVKLNTIKIKDEYFLAKVTVLDLDPKPDNHFAKYLKQTNKAYAARKDQR